MQRSFLINYLNELLMPEKFQDYCANGLQVEGRQEIKKIITGVTACQALLDIAVKENADAVMTHHGYLWRGASPYITGMRKNRLKTLLCHDINLIAYHLPLDAHDLYGTTAQLAKLLHITLDSKIQKPAISFLLRTGKINSISGDDLSLLIEDKLKRKPLYIKGNTRPIETVALCTGSGQDFIEQVVELGIDAYITGEVSERTVHIAREEGIHFYSAGHHATERYGIQLLGEHVAEKFNLDVRFVDIDNPV